VFTSAPVNASAGTPSAAEKNTIYETYYKILEQRYWQDNVYSLKGKTGELIEVPTNPDLINQTFTPGVAYAKLIDFDGNGTEELYMHYLSVDRYEDSIDVSATAEIWTVNKGKAKLVHKEKIRSDGSHISSGKPLLLCKVKGKTYLVSTDSFTTGAGDFDYEYSNFFLVKELANGKFVEKYMLTETYTGLNERSKLYKKYGETIVYDWKISKSGKVIKSGQKAKVAETYHAKEISKITDDYKKADELIHAGTYQYLSCKINDVNSCLKSIRNKITNSKTKEALAKKVKTTLPSKVVKISSSGITIQEYNNFYWDGEDGEGMTLSKTKKTYSFDKYTVFSMLNDQFRDEIVSKSDFVKKNTDSYHSYIITYKGKRVLNISEVYHP
jgi:hypothetical protein